MNGEHKLLMIELKHIRRELKLVRKDNREDHKGIFTRLSEGDTSLSSLKTWRLAHSINQGAIWVVIGLIFKYFII